MKKIPTLFKRDQKWMATMGPHFQGNPENWHEDILLRHGSGMVSLSDYSFDGIRSFLEKTPIEGIVFWKDGMPQCKVKRSDFGFEWPINGTYGADVSDGQRAACPNCMAIMEGEEQ